MQHVMVQEQLTKLCLKFSLISAAIDSTGTVCTVIEKRLQPLPVTLSLSGALNHSKSKFQVGCSFVVG